ACRLVFLWIVLYPVGDLIYEHPTMHALRSLPGLPAFVLLGAVGAVAAVKWLWPRPQFAIPVLSAAALLVIALNINFAQKFFGDDFLWQKQKVPIFSYDVFEAARWLRPHLDEVDAVFVTGAADHPD